MTVPDAWLSRRPRAVQACPGMFTKAATAANPSAGWPSVRDPPPTQPRRQHPNVFQQRHRHRLTGHRRPHDNRRQHRNLRRINHCPRMRPPPRHPITRIGHHKRPQPPKPINPIGLGRSVTQWSIGDIDVLRRPIHGNFGRVRVPIARSFHRDLLAALHRTKIISNPTTAKQPPKVPPNTQPYTITTIVVNQTLTVAPIIVSCDRAKPRTSCRGRRGGAGCRGLFCAPEPGWREARRNGVGLRARCAGPHVPDNRRHRDAPTTIPTTCSDQAHPATHHPSN